MYQCIKNYCENDADNGLFLLDMPTGFGKTYSVLSYIFDACQLEENKERRFFFITPLKKNLPIKDLRDRFDAAGKLSEFDEKFLFIDSISEAILSNYSNSIAKEIPAEITKTKEYKKFRQEIEILQSIKDSSDYQKRQIEKQLEITFRKQTEPAFRKLFAGIFNDKYKYKSVEERLYAIKTENDWKWVGKLYPAVFTLDRQIIFMSMDKFLTQNVTIIEPPYQFYNNKIIEESVVFIDEFDSSKETMLKNIIQNGLEDKIDIIDLFRSIYTSMATMDFPADMTTLSDKQKNRKSNNDIHSLERMLANTHRKAIDIYDKYSLKFNHRTSDDAENAYKNFLFQDHKFCSVLNGKNKYISSVCDTKKRINYIHFTEKPIQKNQRIYEMLGEIRGFISFFLKMVSIFANNYQQLKKERQSVETENELTYEQAVHTILSQFQLRSYEADYLTDQLMMFYRSSRSIETVGTEYDLSVYEKGFRYYCFENDAMHDMQSKIMLCAFQNTPEKILLQLCERAKVIGISATATVPTVIGNFDLHYLRSKMQSSFYKLSQAEHERLLNDFKYSQSGYQNINIRTDLIGAGKYSVRTWYNILDDKELAEQIFYRLEQEIQEENSYNKERYARIAISFKKFLSHQDIRSMLCILTKLPAKDDYILCTESIKYILNLVAGIRPDRENPYIEYLKGDDYEVSKDKILNRLAKGDKVFVISAYQTIGAGQNLQYKIPDELQGRLVRSNDFLSRNEKDFDAIYLDKPTHLFEKMENDWQDESFVKYLFQVEFLLESSELSIDSASKHIQKAFRCYTLRKIPKNVYVDSVYDKQSVRMYATKAVIQAIGRICRTNQKNPDIYIFADDRIADYIDLSVTNGRILNYEFMSLIDRAKGTQRKLPVSGSLKDKAVLISSRAFHDIESLLNYPWNEVTIKKWKNMRLLVLRYPTASEKDVEKNFIFHNYYIKLPELSNILYYSQDEDYRKIRISFEKEYTIHCVENENNTRLDRLMKWESLRSYFISQGYAVSFIPNDYIMSPPIWNNIYKGALGEVAGQFWFLNILNIELEEITDPEQFELFDFKIPDKSIYVDFKNWDEGTEMNWSEEVSKIQGKAEQCGCKCVIISNILTKNDYAIQKFVKGKTDFLIVPSLLKDNGKIEICQNAVESIKECLNAYTD